MTWRDGVFHAGKLKAGKPQEDDWEDNLGLPPMEVDEGVVNTEIGEEAIRAGALLAEREARDKEEKEKRPQWRRVQQGGRV